MPDSYPAPGPYQFAQVPARFFGRSAEPALPPIPGQSDADLERLRAQLVKSGAAPDVLERLAQIKAMRMAEQVDARMRAQLLSPAFQAEQRGSLRQFGHDAAAARQALLEALSQGPQ